MLLPVSLETLLFGLAGGLPLQSDSGDLFLVALGGFGFGLLLMFWGIRKYRKGRLVADTATETVAGMAVGRTELEGVVRPVEEPFRQPFRREPCLYAEWQIEEYRRQGTGKNRRRSWQTVASGSYTEPFVLEDETGRVLIDAETDATWQLTGNCTSSSRVGSRSTPAEAVVEFCEREGVRPTASNRRRYTQTVLRPGTSVYVLGEATPRDFAKTADLEVDLTKAGERLQIERDGASGRFIVSDMSEDELASFYGMRAPLYVFGGLVLSAICLFGLLSLML